MMKKKSMAVAMAAVTVAMPMSQSFAAVVESDQTQAIKDMKAKAFELMNREFTKNKNLLINNGENGTNDISGKKVFKVSIGATTYTRYSDFERAFDTAYAKLEDGQSLTVDYGYACQTKGGADIGYTVLEDGSVVDFEADKFTEAELKALSNGKNADIAKIKVGEVQFKENEDDKSKTYQVRLTDADKHDLKRFADLKVGDAELDFSKPVLRQDAAKDYYVDIDGNSIASVEDGDKTLLDAAKVDTDADRITITRANGDVINASNAVVDGFYLSTKDAAGNYDAEATHIVSDVIKKSVQTTKLNASELFNINEGKVTVEGNTLLNKLQKLTYGLNNVKYDVTTTEAVASQEIKIVIDKTDNNDPHAQKVKVEEIRIARDSADKKGEAYDALKDLLLTKDFSTNAANAGNSANYKNKIATAAGEDRYETAAELSRKQFTKDNFDKTKEKAIVLVTGEQDKLVDGLTATPLAATLNLTTEKVGAIEEGHALGAPVLLTSNNKLSQSVVDEINRLGAEKVYIVGGAISESVEKELENRYGMKVDRVSGDDRYDTALEVADEIYAQRKANNAKDAFSEFDKVFVAGGKSEADALSAGAAAAKFKAPILLTNEAKLNKDVKYYLEGTKVSNNSKAYVVGGSISKSAYNDMLDVQGKDDIKRLSGDTRQDTNAEVIEEFFATGNPSGNTAATKVVVAKSDNKGMVDALGAGLYAGLNNAPVVLATNSLTEDQEDAIDKIVINKNETTINRVAVGNGIASSVIKYIKDMVK